MKEEKGRIEDKCVEGGGLLLYYCKPTNVMVDKGKKETHTAIIVRNKKTKE